MKKYKRQYNDQQNISNKPKLKFMLDYECSVLWANDDITRSAFGYNVNLKDISTSQIAINLESLVIDMLNHALNPIYQGLPTFWSRKFI